MDDDLVAFVVQGVDLDAQLEGDAEVVKRGSDSVGDVAVDAGKEFLAGVENRHLRAEVGEHAREFQPDETAADDDQARGQRIDVLDGGRVEHRGTIAVSSSWIDQLQTSVPGVYAVGDINGGPQFTYISLDDNRIVWDAVMAEGRRRRSDRVAVPTTTFITPPLSMVGMSESEARRSDRRVLVAKKEVAQIAAMPRPKIVGETHGLIKILVDADTHQLLGATIFSIDSQELVNMMALAIRLNATLEDLRDGIWTHPSSTEAFNEVLGALQPLD